MVYSHPTANHKKTGMYSFTPRIFILSLEPLLATIRNSIGIGVIRTGDDEHKIVTYADDVLSYISNPTITLPNLLKLFKYYRELSNLKMNASKSEILNINLSKHEEQAPQQKCPFTWRKTELEYLGIKFTPPLGKIYQTNYIPLLYMC